MTREILFRGKRLDNGEWEIGDLVHVKGGSLILPIGKGWDQHRVAPETVGQWTGITDTNGQRIFEGDIIECISSDGTPIRHYIKYHNRECLYIQYIIEEGLPHGFNDGGRICQSYIDKFSKRVVGNIWDNKDLIKTE